MDIDGQLYTPAVLPTHSYGKEHLFLLDTSVGRDSPYFTVREVPLILIDFSGP